MQWCEEFELLDLARSVSTILIALILPAWSEYIHVTHNLRCFVNGVSS